MFGMLHAEQSFLLSFFALTVVATTSGGFCCQTRFVGGGGNTLETFKSVDLDFLVP